eukprot:scaffold681302_cov47-Attheya_sp.AAC.1
MVIGESIIIIRMGIIMIRIVWLLLLWRRRVGIIIIIRRRRGGMSSSGFGKGVAIGVGAGTKVNAIVIVIPGIRDEDPSGQSQHGNPYKGRIIGKNPLHLFPRPQEVPTSFGRNSMTNRTRYR